MAVSVLEIKIYDERECFTYGGDLHKIARAIARIGLKNDEFALALNLAIAGMNEELEAKRLRDEMIGFIFNTDEQ